jgi:hypothetical protein
MSVASALKRDSAPQVLSLVSSLLCHFLLESIPDPPELGIKNPRAAAPMATNNLKTNKMPIHLDFLCVCLLRKDSLQSNTAGKKIWRGRQNR